MLMNMDDQRLFVMAEALRRGYLAGGDQRHHQGGPLVPGPAIRPSSTWRTPSGPRPSGPRSMLRRAKEMGFTDADIAVLHRATTPRQGDQGLCARAPASSPPSRWWTPAPPSSTRRPPITTPPMTRRTRPSPERCDQRASGKQGRHGAGQRPHPHRPGHRV